MKVMINGSIINYEVFGYGQPIICIHGWNEDSKVFKSRYYKNMLKSYKVYAVDLPGFGASDSLKKYTFDILNDIIMQFTIYMGLERFNLMGQCMGGIIALDFAIRHEYKIKKLILIETMIYFPVWLNLLLVRHFNLWAMKLMLKKKTGIVLMNFHRIFRKAGKNKKLLALFKRADITQSLNYIKLMKDYSKYDHIERARGMKIPVTIIITQNTFSQVKTTASNLTKVLGKAQIFCTPDRSHFIYID